MALEFLETQDKKIVRTTLYNDQEFTAWELELLHTPIFQRLYNLRQLGFTDKVFPDAVHTRFNHVLGVAEMAERMAEHLAKWLEKHSESLFEYARESSGSSAEEWQIESIDGAKLAKHVRDHIPTVRLIALLHDLTHAAFGHTLEDEVSVFTEKHDKPERQKRFFDALVGQLLYLWVIELGTQEPDPVMLDKLAHLEVDGAAAKNWVEELYGQLGEKSAKLARYLRELEMAFSLLTYLEFLHDPAEYKHVAPTPPSFLVSDAIKCLDSTLGELDLILHRDAIFVDIIGNTICADLMDYARRDPHNAGLRVQFDDRVIRYVCSVSVKDQLSPTRQPCIRLAVQFFTDKMRHDVLSEMSGILKARYLINERVLFHPTKCAAGAMLGTAVLLLGLRQPPVWMQILGDQEFLRLLIDLAQKMQDELQRPSVNNSNSDRTARPPNRVDDLVNDCLDTVEKECREHRALPSPIDRVKGARVLLWRLIGRRYPKLVFRLRSGLQHSGGDNDEALAKKYKDPDERFRLEREVESACHLPPGSLVIHCPTRKMSMKVAQALVVGSDLTKVAPLREVNTVAPELLEPYQKEITAVEEMYKAIWQFHAFLDTSQYKKRNLVAKTLDKKLGFPNDKLLEKTILPRRDFEESYDLLATELLDTFAWDQLPEIARRIDQEGMRQRNGIEESPRARTSRIINEVAAENTRPSIAAPPAKDSETQQLAMKLETSDK